MSTIIIAILGAIFILGSIWLIFYLFDILEGAGVFIGIGVVFVFAFIISPLDNRR